MTTTRREFLGATALLSTVVLAGCGSDDEDPAPAGRTRRVRTVRGTVAIPARPRRIVVANGALAGYFFALGAKVAAADARVLGGKPDSSGFPTVWSSYAERQGTMALPAADSLDIEAVTAARPDLIVGGGQGFPGALADRAYSRLTRIAPTVIVDKRLTSWQSELRFVAGMLGARSRGDELIANYRRRLAQVKKAITLPPQPVTVLYASGPKTYLLYENAVLLKLLGELGFRADGVRAKAGNPKPYQPDGDAFEVSRERLSDVANAPSLFVLALSGVTAAQLRKQEIYPALPAFRAGHVHDLPPFSYRPDYLAAMRTLDVVEKLFA